MMKRLMIIMVLALCVVSCTRQQPSHSTFGNITTFRKGTAVSFPDFTLTYLGYPKKKHPPYGYRAHDFAVKSKTGDQVVHYINGGEVFPAEFEANGQKYMLELVSSLALDTTLQEDQLVLWRKDTWSQRYSAVVNNMNRQK